jgi:CubicO group peptidase (beta-lactamase class C family)
MAPLTNRRHLLAHTAGLPDWDGPVEDLYDWPSATARLAAQAPQWEPGSAAGYHSLTQGFLVGEVVRRIAGRSLGDFFAQEVAGPLGADFHIGLPPEHDHRVALTVPPPSRDENYAASAPGSSAPPPPAPVYGSMTGTASPGAVRRSPPRADSATPARSPSCSR